MQAQFRLVEAISRHLPNGQVLELGDLGVAAPFGAPRTTRAVEEILTSYFDVEAAILVRGSGTGAIREVMFAAFPPGSTILFHDAPIYHTTRVTIEAMGITPLFADFNRLPYVDLPRNGDVAGAFIQHSRQRTGDRYDLDTTIGYLREQLGSIPIITDDNYTVLKTPKIGAQLGADASAFSVFKLLGPEGIGAVLGRRRLVEVIRDHNRSGGCQIQGFEAMETLRGMVYVPVAAAVQAMVTRRVMERLNAGEVPGIDWAVAANSEETVVLARLCEPIAKDVIRRAAELGAAPHPVGAESRYELAPMFYRVSKATLIEHPEWADTVIRINPFRAGDDQIIDILSHALSSVAGAEEL